jgi:hypothetical protein
MTETVAPRTGGCLCGAVRYEISGEALFAGHCYCADCQKVSGSGFVPFMGVAAKGFRVSGPTERFVCPAARGGEAVRNFCARCHSLLFGGIVGVHDTHTVYAGGLDDVSWFKPQIAIFASRRAPWALIPPGLTVFEEMPPG